MAFSRSLVVALGALTIVSGSVGTAQAHAFLVSATPSVGSTVATPPAALVLHYTENLAGPFCTVTVTNAAGKPVQTARPQPVPGHPDSISVPLHITAPGKY